MSKTKIQLANLISREFMLESDTSGGVWLPKQLLLKAESTSCTLLPNEASLASDAGLGPVETPVRLCVWLTDQMSSNWAAIGLIGKLKL